VGEVDSTVQQRSSVLRRSTSGQKNQQKIPRQNNKADKKVNNISSAKKSIELVREFEESEKVSFEYQAKSKSVGK